MLPKPQIKFITIVIALAVFLSACKVSKDVAVPTPALPDTFRNAAVDAGDTGSVADLPWQDFFADTTLQRLIAHAITNNFDMQIALKNVEASDLLFRQVKWNYLPDFNLQANATSSRPSDNSLNGLSTQTFLKTNHVEDYSVGIGLSWEADIWGKIRNQNKRALAAYLQTQEARKAIQTQIVSNVANGYYNLMMLDAQMEVVKKNIVLNDSTVRMVQLLYESGRVTSLALAQATAQLQAAQQLIPKLEQDILLQENALSVLSGDLPERIKRSNTLAQISVTDDYATGFPSAIVSRRTDVRTAEMDLTIANANVGITKANMYPALRITASGGLNSFKASNWFNIPASVFGMVSGSLLQPLLNKKQLKTQFEVAKVEREKVVLQFRQQVLVAVGEVSDALAKIDKLKEQYEIAAQRKNTLQGAIGVSNLLFESGMANYLEVIVAQGNALQNELEIAAIKRDQLNAGVDLYRSLGGGWK